MADVHHNAVLNDLLIDLSRCLLQYVGECWPWTAGDEEERRTLDELVARQRLSAARVLELLDRRRHPIESGTYPTDFTDLHYLALDHLLSLLVESQQVLLERIQLAKDQCAGDVKAVALIEQILADERESLKRLKELAVKAPSGNAA